MEKHYLKLLMAMVMILFATNKGFSQENQAPTKPTFKKHEFNVSVGILNTIEVHPLLTFSDRIPLFSYKSKSDLLFFKIGSFNFEYNLNLSKIYSIGVSLSYTYSRNNEIDYLWDMTPFYYDIHSHFLSIIVNNKFNYIRKKNYNIYTGFGIGITQIFREHNEYYNPLSGYYIDFNLCLFGILLKNKIPLFFEIGLGPQGIFKVGYKF